MSDERAESNRRAELLRAPIAERVERFAELALRIDDEEASEEVERGHKVEMWVVGATIVADVLGAVIRAADALDALAAHARAREAGGVPTHTGGAA